MSEEGGDHPREGRIKVRKWCFELDLHASWIFRIGVFFLWSSSERVWLVWRVLVLLGVAEGHFPNQCKTRSSC